MNPAVSLAMVVVGKLKLWKFPFYVVAQFLGAFAGAAAVFGLYYGNNTSLLLLYYGNNTSLLLLYYGNNTS